MLRSEVGAARLESRCVQLRRSGVEGPSCALQGIRGITPAQRAPSTRKKWSPTELSASAVGSFGFRLAYPQSQRGRRQKMPDGAKRETRVHTRILSARSRSKPDYMM